MPTTMPAEGRRGCQQTRRTRSKKSRGAFGAARIPNRFSTYQNIIVVILISLMSGPRPPPEGLPGKRPAPVVPRPRTIGCVVGSDSYGSNEEIWQDFVNAGLIPEDPRCPICNRPLPTESARRDLHFSLRCRPCDETVNVIASSHLWDVRNIRKFLATLEGWCNGNTACSIQAMAGITKRTWFHYRDIFFNVVEATLRRAREDGNLMLGGPGVIVEVDECHLHKRKYNRGNVLASEAIWVVGLIERRNDGERRSAFMLTVRRNADVLIPFIQANVLPGSILISDQWKAYTDELERDFTRFTINHSVEYGRTIVISDMVIPINTNHIEREWVEVRKVVRHVAEDRYMLEFEREVFRMLYFNGHSRKERPFIFLEKMAQLVH